MKRNLILMFFLAIFCQLNAQNIVGEWSGELDIQGTKLPLVFRISKTDKGFTTTIDSPMQGVKDIPTGQTDFSNNQLTIVASKMMMEYKGVLENNAIQGTFTQGGMSLPLNLQAGTGAVKMNRPQQPKAPFDYMIEDVSFVNPKDKNTLAGTFTYPKNKKDFPVVVLITGSGAQNRDSELFGHKAFWVIADDFAKKGIGVLRLDDRGTGSSSKGSMHDTSENFATDISTAVDFLFQKGYKNIGLAGHSEGGMIAPITALMNQKVKFLISMAGPGIPIDELMVLQTQAVLKSQGATEEEVQRTSENNRKLYSFVKNYKGANLENDTKQFLIKEFTNANPDKKIDSEIEEQINSQVFQITYPWFVYFLKYNPDTNWSKIKIPVLAINGDKDIQVLAKENLDGIKKSLDKAQNKKVTLKTFENLNHLLQTCKVCSVEEYAELEETISPNVLQTISDWILSLK